MTPHKDEGGAFSKNGETTWKVLLLVGGIVFATVQLLTTVRAMTKTDEVLVAITTLQVQVKGLTDFKDGQDGRIRALEFDAAKTRERLAGIEGAKGAAAPATYRTP